MSPSPSANAPAASTPGATRSDDPSLPPLQSPLPHSDILDREEPAFVDEPDLPDDASDPTPAVTPKAAHDAAGPDSVAGEEDPGAGMEDPQAPPPPARP